MCHVKGGLRPTPPPKSKVNMAPPLPEESKRGSLSLIFYELQPTSLLLLDPPLSPLQMGKIPSL